jgi:hypothetical protein
VPYEYAVQMSVFGSRWMDPGLGRFTTPDGGGPGFSPYPVAGNSVPNVEGPSWWSSTWAGMVVNDVGAYVGAVTSGPQYPGGTFWGQFWAPAGRAYNASFLFRGAVDTTSVVGHTVGGVTNALTLGGQQALLDLGGYDEKWMSESDRIGWNVGEVGGTIASFFLGYGAVGSTARAANAGRSARIVAAWGSRARSSYRVAQVGRSMEGYGDWSLRNQDSRWALNSESARWLKLAGTGVKSVGMAGLLSGPMGVAFGAVNRAGAVGRLTARGGGLWLGKEAIVGAVNRFRSEGHLTDRLSGLVEFAGGLAGLRWSAVRDFKVGAAIGGRATESAVSGLVHNQAMRRLGLHSAATDAAEWAGFKACFAAGTPLRTPTGSVMIENVRVGDLVLSRDEHNPDGLVVAQTVEEVFVREALVMHLHLPHGVVIRTTAEHPFYADGKGWVACQELSAGDRLLCEDGSWVAVGEVFDTGCWETVYNLRVADFHTYFVGCDEWGFSVWAHNATYGDNSPERAASHELVRKVSDEALHQIQVAHGAGLAEARYTSVHTGQQIVLRVSEGKPSIGGRGPALAVVHDKLTGEVFIRQNESSVPDILHPHVEGAIAWRDWQTDATYHNTSPGVPGRHAEAIALNDALLARDPTGRTFTPEMLGDFTVHVVNTQAIPGTTGWGQPFVRCQNCRAVTFGTDVITDRLDTIAFSERWWFAKFQR